MSQNFIVWCPVCSWEVSAQELSWDYIYRTPFDPRYPRGRRTPVGIVTEYRCRDCGSVIEIAEPVNPA